MKILKIIGIILGALVLIFLLGPLFLSSSAHIERSATIDAPAAAVFAQVNNLKNWEKWGPWMAEDPDVAIIYGDKVAGVGASYSWTSEEMGNGSVTIMESVPFSDTKNELNFEGMGKSYGSWHFEETNNQTTATWGFDFEMEGLSKWYGLVMEGSMGNFLEKGLASIKEIAEGKPEILTTYRGYSIEEIDFSGRSFVGVRGKIGVEKISDFFSKNFPAIAGKLASEGIEMTGQPCGLFYDWDEENNMTDMAAGIPVGSKTVLGGEFESIELVAGKALLINYFGAYQDSGEAHFAMEDYIKEKGLSAKTPAIEEYVTDPTTEPDTSKWLTKIYYLVEM